MMTIKRNVKADYLNVKATHISLNRRAMILNVVALTILFVGYLLTTGTGLLDSDGLKAIFRISSLLVLLSNLFVDGEIKVKFLVAILLIAFSLLLSQSPFSLNIIFLLLITASLSRLNLKELAITLIIPTLIVVGVHLLLLTTGKISAEEVQVADRTRSSFGFANPNQVSVVYFSLVMISTFLDIAFKRRFSFLLMLASYFLAFSIFLVTDSRTSLLSIIFLAFLTLFNHIFHKNKFYRFIVFFSGFLAPILAAVITIYITNSAGTELDIILSLRPYFFSEFITTASASDIVFGWRDPDDSAVDNLFLPLLSAVGIIGCVGIIFFIAVRTYKMQFEFIPLIATLMIASIFESFLLRPEIPSSVLFMAMLFSPLKQKLKIPRT